MVIAGFAVLTVIQRHAPGLHRGGHQNEQIRVRPIASLRNLNLLGFMGLDAGQTKMLKRFLSQGSRTA